MGLLGSNRERITSPGRVGSHQLTPTRPESSAIGRLAAKMRMFLSEDDKNSFTYQLL